MAEDRNGNGGARNPERTTQPLEDMGAGPRQEAASPGPNGWRAECGAKTRSGKPCRLPPVAGRTRCRKHGGATPVGAASPHYRGKGRSKYLADLPSTLRPRYKAALADPQLLSLTGELALLEARTGELLARLSATEAPPWGAACEALNDFKLARKEEDRQAKLAALETVIRTGADAARTHQATWAELLNVIALKGKTAASEAKRVADLQGVIRVDQVMLFVDVLLAAAEEAVSDPRALRRLYDTVLRMMPPAAGRVRVVDAAVVDALPAPAAEPEPQPEEAPPPAGFAGPQAAQADAASLVASCDEPAPAPAVPPPLPCGLRELPPLPPGADPAEWELVDDNEEDAGDG